MSLLFCNAAGATKGNVIKSDWAHVFLTVTEPLDVLSAQQEEQTAAALRAACADLMTKHGGQLRRAAVAQWEVRLAAADGAPAWRVVVASPTGDGSNSNHKLNNGENLVSGAHSTKSPSL